MPFLKGHGTENDFVIIPDFEGRLPLSAAAVARLCDRRAGVGGDGVLRVVRAAAHPEGRAMADHAEWFMDYRNGDGGVAEMCGNGVRVFAHYLRRAGLVGPGELPVATRAGVRRVRFTGPAPGGAPGGDPGGAAGPAAGAGDAGDIAVEMGQAKLPDGPEAAVTVAVGGRSWPAHRIDMGNPHAVAFVDSLADAGPLAEAPAVPAEAYPEGANVEFVVDRGPGHLALRVHERGSGETRSCGTGACAAMVAAARRAGRDPAVDGRDAGYTVDVPGGRLRVTEAPDGTVTLSGPAAIVAEGTLDPALLAA